MLPVSVCIIAKNEEKKLERCLSSLAPYHFEIVVVDTGSTDQTKELASKYTDKIYDYEWQDDFSAARNYSLEMASHQWILMLDCDEWIEYIDTEELTYMMKHLPNAAGSVSRQNLVGNPASPSRTLDYTERFFSKKKFHYTGIIHEQLTPKYNGTFETFLLNATIGHDGYLMTDAERAIKSKRNIDLLTRQLSKQPDNPYVLYQLGKGYEMINDYASAAHYFEQALKPGLDSELAYVQSLAFSYAESLLKADRMQKAYALLPYLSTFRDSADITYIMGRIYLKGKQYEQALDQFEKALTFETCRRVGVNSFLSYYEIGRILSMISEWELARNYFLQCGNYGPALHALKVLDEENL